VIILWNHCCSACAITPERIFGKTQIVHPDCVAPHFYFPVFAVRMRSSSFHTQAKSKGKETGGRKQMGLAAFLVCTIAYTTRMQGIFVFCNA
jgi:hypothetical protein